MRKTASLNRLKTSKEDELVIKHLLTKRSPDPLGFIDDFY
jgi:hypothetical protein